MKFNIGQKVKWRGVVGTILSYDARKKIYSVAVMFGVVKTNESQLTEA